MRALTHSIGLVSLLVAGAACDTTPRGRDAAAGPQRASEAAIRFEVVGDGAPAVSMLAFRASTSGPLADDLLAIVDPLTAPAPEAACVLRDVAGPARALGAAGGKVELEALQGLRLDLGFPAALDAAAGLGSANVTPSAPAPATSLAVVPSPRVYPDLASVVGGVVAEAGPVTLERTPVALTLVDSSGGHTALAVPALPHLTGPEGDPLPANTTLAVTGDLGLGVTSGPQGLRPTFLELRPFGATWALACPVNSHDRAVIPAVEVMRLANLHVPVSIEAVARESHAVALGGGSSVRLTLEVRSSSVVELRP